METDLQILQKKYYLKKMEVNSLLEITQAINENLDKNALFKIYDFTIRANLNVGKLAMFVYDGTWICEAFFGVSSEVESTPLPDQVLQIEEENYGPFPSPLEEFEVVIPIKHKSTILSYVFVAPSEQSDVKINTIFLQAISNLIIVAIENQRLTSSQIKEEAYRRELEIAKEVQKLLFPENLPYGVRLKVEASYLPHQSVGGDYYDYIPINENQFLICIADVSGKGVPAALMMSNFQASLRTLLRTTPNLTEIVEIINYQILQNAKGDNFITFFGAIYDHKLNTLVYVNAGHNPPYLYNREKGMQTLEEGCTVLGMFHPLPFLNEGFITDLDNFTLLLYTDGVTETENENEEEFGSERIEQFLENNRDKDLKELHKGLLEELDKFKGKKEYRDDITILTCRLEER